MPQGEQKANNLLGKGTAATLHIPVLSPDVPVSAPPHSSGFCSPVIDEELGLAAYSRRPRSVKRFQEAASPFPNLQLTSTDHRNQTEMLD